VCVYEFASLQVSGRYESFSTSFLHLLIFISTTVCIHVLFFSSRGISRVPLTCQFMMLAPSPSLLPNKILPPPNFCQMESRHEMTMRERLVEIWETREGDRLAHTHHETSSFSLFISRVLLLKITDTHQNMPFYLYFPSLPRLSVNTGCC